MRGHVLPPERAQYLGVQALFAPTSRRVGLLTWLSLEETR